MNGEEPNQVLSNGAPHRLLTSSPTTRKQGKTYFKIPLDLSLLTTKNPKDETSSNYLEAKLQHKPACVPGLVTK